MTVTAQEQASLCYRRFSTIDLHHHYTCHNNKAMSRAPNSHQQSCTCGCRVKWSANTTGGRRHQQLTNELSLITATVPSLEQQMSSSLHLPSQLTHFDSTGNQRVISRVEVVNTIDFLDRVPPSTTPLPHFTHSYLTPNLRIGCASAEATRSDIQLIKDFSDDLFTRSNCTARNSQQKCYCQHSEHTLNLREHIML